MRTQGAALTGVCDADVDEIPQCQKAVDNPKNRGIWSIGAVGRCLSRQLAENRALTLDCRSLVIVAAPKVLCYHTLLGNASQGPGDLDSMVQLVEALEMPLSSRFVIPVDWKWTCTRTCLMFVQDAQQMFDSSMTAAAIAQRVQELQAAAGIKAQLVSHRGHYRFVIPADDVCLRIISLS